MPFSSRAISAAAALSLAACGLDGPAYDEPPPTVDAVVDMTTLLDFDPERLTIGAGDTVEWRNTSIMDHTVTADPALADDPAHVRLPPGAEPFDSGSIEPGQVYRRTFTVPGDYVYFCIPHEGQGMVARLTVRQAGS